jgi:hypothetical protein
MARERVTDLTPQRNHDQMRGMLDRLQEHVDHYYLLALLEHDKKKSREHLLVRQGIKAIRENLHTG